MKTIPLTQGFSAIIDDEDFELVSKHKWHVHHSGKNHYAVANVTLPDGRRTTIQMHALILGNPGSITDHKDGDGLKNTRSNLRPCTHQQNIFNQGVQAHVSKTSRYKGVHLFEKKWLARIMINKKMNHLGSFENESDAARAYDRAAKELFGEFARLNFPND